MWSQFLSTRPPVSPNDKEHILTHTLGLWDELSGERIFISGGTGFFGTWLLEAIHAANQRLNAKIAVTVLTRNAAQFADRLPHLAEASWLSSIEGDITSFIHPPGEFPHIIHAATPASATLNATAPMEMLAINIDGTRHLLEFAQRARTKRLLLTSSGAIYGPQPADLENVDETYCGAPDPLSTTSAYAEGKRVAELMCALESSKGGMETKIARCFAFVGPHLPLDTHFAIGNFMRDTLAGNDLVIKGDGTPLRSYLYAADLIIWLLTILIKGQNNRPYNVGSPLPISIAALAEKIALLSPRPRKTIILGQTIPGKNPERYVPCVKRAERELGLSSLISLDEGIKRTLDWHRNFT